MPITNAKEVRLVVLYCGQGMSNWIEIFDKSQTDDAPSATLLIDFGRYRFGGDTTSKTIPVDYVVGRLIEMRTAERIPSIDLTVISHQDHDHWALIPRLTERLAAEVPTVQLGKIIRGGELWSSSALQALDEYAATSSGTPKPLVAYFVPDTTDYAAPPDVRRLATFGDVYVSVLISNLTGLGTTMDDIIKNATSAVIVVEFKNYTFLLPGDATVQTIVKMNQLLTAYGSTTLPKPLRTCWAMALPHHGSHRTFVDASATDPFGPGRVFAGLVEAKATPASAGHNNRHHHPQIGIFNIFVPYLKDDYPWHTIVAFYPELDTFWKFPPTRSGMFTTVENNDDPPSTRNLVFSVTSTMVEGREVVEAFAETLELGPSSPTLRTPIRAYAAAELSS